MRPKADSGARADQCNERYRRGNFKSLQLGSADDPFTVRIPGFNDIFKTPWNQNPEAGKNRVKQFRENNSAMPDALKWAPALLNKIDDAQDILSTALLAGWPVLRALGNITYTGTIRAATGLIPIVRSLAPRLLGPVGILLTWNDLLNAFS
jgi:hypothetical protein